MIKRGRDYTNRSPKDQSWCVWLSKFRLDIVDLTSTHGEGSGTSLLDRG